MAADPSGSLVAEVKALLRADPKLGNSSNYVKAFSANLNDRQGEAEKSTPETEWRRMRELWAKIRLASLALTAITRELETQGKVSLTIAEQLGSVSEPSADAYDPISGSVARGAAGGGEAGESTLPKAIKALRTAIAIGRRRTEQAITDEALFILKDGTRAFTGDQSMGSHKLTSVTDPTTAQDAATKAYADLFLKRDGTNAMTADLDAGTHKVTNVVSPAATTDAANKSYVDAADATNLALVIKKDGSVAFTGNQSMGSNKLTSLSTGTAGTDAVNKTQMDVADALAIPKSRKSVV